MKTSSDEPYVNLWKARGLQEWKANETGRQKLREFKRRWKGHMKNYQDHRKYNDRLTLEDAAQIEQMADAMWPFEDEQPHVRPLCERGNLQEMVPQPIFILHLNTFLNTFRNDSSIVLVRQLLSRFPTIAHNPASMSAAGRWRLRAPWLQKLDLTIRNRDGSQNQNLSAVKAKLRRAWEFSCERLRMSHFAVPTPSRSGGIPEAARWFDSCVAARELQGTQRGSDPVCGSEAKRELKPWRSWCIRGSARKHPMLVTMAEKCTM